MKKIDKYSDRLWMIKRNRNNRKHNNPVINYINNKDIINSRQMMNWHIEIIMRMVINRWLLRVRLITHRSVILINSSRLGSMVVYMLVMISITILNLFWKSIYQSRLIWLIVNTNWKILNQSPLRLYCMMRRVICSTIVSRRRRIRWN